MSACRRLGGCRGRAAAAARAPRLTVHARMGEWLLPHSSMYVGILQLDSRSSATTCTSPTCIFVLQAVSRNLASAAALFHQHLWWLTDASQSTKRLNYPALCVACRVCCCCPAGSNCRQVPPSSSGASRPPQHEHQKSTATASTAAAGRSRDISSIRDVPRRSATHPPAQASCAVSSCVHPATRALRGD
jgi:hypothetical protein